MTNKAMVQQLWIIEQAEAYRKWLWNNLETLEKISSRYFDNNPNTPIEETTSRVIEVLSSHRNWHLITWDRKWDFDLIWVEEFKISEKQEQELIFAYGNYIALKKLAESKELESFQAEFNKLSTHLETIGVDLLIALDWRDTSWKWGLIDRLLHRYNRKKFINIAPWIPTEKELKMDYFERYLRMLWDLIVLTKRKNWFNIKHTWKWRIITFDRSWYNLLYIWKVLGFCSEKEYKNYLSRIVWFEESLPERTIDLYKFYLSITKETQRLRLEDRKWSALKWHKISPTDYVAHDKFDEFTPVKEEVHSIASTEKNPILIVDANDKHLWRLAILYSILEPYIWHYNDSIDLNKKLNILDTSLVVSAKIKK